jgi:heme exporter protein A
VGTVSEARISEVALREVRKVYGRHLALSGVSAHLAGGELALVLGPNGAGKSTLLGILSTLSRPTSGEVLYGARDHRFAEENLRDRIGLCAHAPMLYRQLTGRENLRFFARLHGVSGAEAVVERWLDRVGMTEFADKPTLELSRGMAQRLALALALLAEPDLLLLDEPFTGLDREATELLRSELTAARAAGKIVVVVSHELGAVDGLAQHLIVLRRGRVATELREPALAATRIQEAYRDALG